MLGRIAALLALTVFYLAIPNARPDFTRFNCHDSESYFALAHSLAHGRGYTRSLLPDMYIPHTTWPPGLPVLLIPAAALGPGPLSWLAAKWTMAAVGLLGVVLAWFLARRLTGHEHLADLAALIVGLNPLYWDFSHQIMAEVPLIVWLLGGLLLVNLVWSERVVRSWEALGTGLVCGLGVLIKGHAVALALAPLAYVVSTRQVSFPVVQRCFRYALFCFAFALPEVALMVRHGSVQATGFDGINQVRMLRHKEGCDWHSDLLTARESFAILKKNVTEHSLYHIPSQVIPGLWQRFWFTWRGSGYLALLLGALLLGVTLSGRPEVRLLHLVIWPIVAFNLQYEKGGAPRFWVPVGILFSVILTVRVRPYLLLDRLSMTMRYAALSVILLTSLSCYVFEHEQAPYEQSCPWRELVELFEQVADHPVATTGVLTPNYLAFQLLTGVPAPIPDPALSPVYEHMIARLDGVDPRPPSDGRVLLSVYPWALYALSGPKTAAELLDAGLYAQGHYKTGIRVLPYASRQAR